MKVSATTNKKFQPIVLAITIETPEELCDLWHRVNVNSDYINESSGEDLKIKAGEDSSSKLFELLDRLVVQNDLYA